jgi:hypothetical protein
MSAAAASGRLRNREMSAGMVLFKRSTLNDKVNRLFLIKKYQKKQVLSTKELSWRLGKPKPMSQEMIDNTVLF